MNKLLNEYLIGYQISSILIALDNIGLEKFWGKGSKADEIFRTIFVGDRLSIGIINAAISANILIKRDSRYKLNPIYIHGIPDLKTLKTTIRYQKLYIPHWLSISNISKNSYPNIGPLDEWIVYVANMHEKLYNVVLEKLPFTYIKNILDVGAGAGELTIKILKKFSSIQATLLDLQPITKIIKSNLKAIPELIDRTIVITGNAVNIKFKKDRFDLIILSNILHLIEIEKRKNLLDNLKAALSDKGTLLIVETILNEEKTYPKINALFNISVLLRSKGKGGLFSKSELKNLLNESGLHLIKFIKVDKEIDPLYRTYSIITAQKLG